MKEATKKILDNPIGAWVARILIIVLITLLGWGCKFWLNKNYQRIEQAAEAHVELSLIHI